MFVLWATTDDAWAEGVTNETLAARLERYLDGVDPDDSIHLMLFSHGVESVGLPSIARWRSVLARARCEGRFVGVNEPRDFATFVRYHTDIKRIPARSPVPERVALAHLAGFLEQAGNTCAVRRTPSP